MKQQSQTKLLLGIGAISAAVIAGYFGLDHFTGKKAASSEAAIASSGGDYSAAIATATENAMAGSAGDAALTAADAARIGEEVARQVATQVAQAIVDQKLAAGGSAGESTGGGLSEADARRIGEEEGRKVAEEVAATTVQQMLAASGGSSGGSGLSAAEAEEIGLAAGRRAAQQVAADTAREVVRSEFGGRAVAKSEPAPSRAKTTVAKAPTSTAHSSSKVKPTARGRTVTGADALSAWWTAPASGDFGLVYAGQAKGESTIALLFSDQPASSALNENVKVYDAKGKQVSGQWETSSNPRLALLRGLKPGRYTVVVGATLADANGKAVKKAEHGPVYVI